MKPLERIENFFGKSLNRIIREEHFAAGKSLKTLSEICGVSRQSIQNCCRSQGIKTRSHLAAVQIAARYGAAHPLFGTKRPDASARMKRHNPNKNPKISAARAETVALHFRKNPWPQEQRFLDIVTPLGFPFIFQFPIGPYVVDFFFPAGNWCVEIDSIKKWGRKRREAAAKKDRFLRRRGFKVLRIDKRETDILNILYANNVVGKS